jgi:capsular polysaccharide export protein
MLSESKNAPTTVFAYGFSFRKRAIVRRFLPNVRVRFSNKTQHLPAGSTLLLWGSQKLPDNTPNDIKLTRLEDGFLRSVGLGADLIHPISWVIDQTGIYYDASTPSDLENLLRSTDFSPELLKRAANLRQRIVESGLSKYNLSAKAWVRPSHSLTVILVPGQVETDASIRYAAVGINTNMALLQAVREANPSAYIVYKPHPDVVAGLRSEGLGESKAAQWCNEIVFDASIQTMLDSVDEVHVMTSLTGFEALLRGKKVVCYGLPFYAGWGLTNDILPLARRDKVLSLDALIAASLILYPTYLSRKTREITTPEHVLEELIAWREDENKNNKNNLWRKIVRLGLTLGSKNK